MPGAAFARRVTPMRLSVICPYCGGLRCGRCGDTGRVELYLSGLTVLVVALTFVLGAALGYWWHGSMIAHGQQVVVEVGEPVPPPTCGEYWVVTPSDTMWSIASRCYPGRHTGQMVSEIRRLNPGLDPGGLRVGQTLRLPVATEVAGGADQ